MLRGHKLALLNKVIRVLEVFIGGAVVLFGGHGLQN